jgi:hypothetical protein
LFATIETDPLPDGAITAAFGYLFNDVALSCRQLGSGFGPFLHCGTFVYDPNTGQVKAQFSLQGGATTFDPQGSTSNTANDDLTAFKNGTSQVYVITPPPGQSQAAFDQTVTNDGYSYQALFYGLVNSNSNTAAAAIIDQAGGKVPFVGNAPGLNPNTGHEIVDQFR